MDSALAWLLDPVSEDSPAGENLEDTALLASFDSYRVFGQMTPLSDEIDWRGLRSAAEEALQQSRDFRLLANYAVARLQVEGLPQFCNTLPVAAAWLEKFPDHVYPLIDDDAIMRRNALNNFADTLGVLDAVRRAHFVRHPALGAFSLRDLEIAKGLLAVPEGEPPGANEAQINGALAALSDEDLEAAVAAYAAGVEALQQIEARMRDAYGVEGTPELGPLRTQLKQIHDLHAEQHALRVAAAAAAAGSGAAGDAGGQAAGAVIGVGSIRSREDAARALDAVAEFFRKNEPSSPVPMVVDRAKRLISLNFLEVLQDLAPDGLDEAKRIGGIRDE